jgi:flagellar motor switch protein FliM
MTDATVQNLGRAKIQQLLAAVGSAPSDAMDIPEAVAYDWRDPHYFNEDQCNWLAAVMSQVSALLAEQFAHYYGGEFNVTPSSIVQFYAADLPNHIARANMLALVFTNEDDQLAGYMAIDAKTALDWGMRLLGDTEGGDDPNRTLSSLEESLLTDLASALGQAFLDAVGERLPLKAGNEMLKSCPDLGLDSTEAACKIVFQIKQTDSEDVSEAVFLFPCQALISLAGKQMETIAGLPPSELNRVMMGHVQQIPVSVTARLAATRLSFQAVLDLAPDDILLMDKSIDAFIDVIVDDRAVFRGRPAQSGGQYAVYITKPADSSEVDTTSGTH